MSQADFPAYHPDTLAVRAGIERTPFGEHGDAMYLTSSFVFDNAAQAAARFSGAEEGYVYARFSNPTVTAMQTRLAAMEGAEACIATASGMSAILSLAMATMQAGDHVVASNGLFGATQQLFGGILSKFGITTTFVAATDLDAWRDAITPQTKLFFTETPSNPLTEVIDIAGVAAIAREAGVLFAVDNCFCSPALQRPLELGADVVVHSATKYLDGQGRVLGGAVAGRKAVTDEVFKFLRTAGPTLSPFNAWVILKGLETLRIRMEAQSASALELARWLEVQPGVARVYYPGLASHPQHALAMRQQSGLGGAVLSFDVRASDPETARTRAFHAIDSTRVCSITANLGDTKTTITHPASTSHGRLTEAQRQAAGLGQGLIRVAVGLEYIDDLKTDLARGLDTLP